jgi:CspA family cold shock protein
MSNGDGFSTGSVKWFNAQKAFGFISLPEGGMDVFVHANQLRKSGILRCLLEGEQLKFRISNGDKGKFATDISVVAAPAKEG